MVPMTYFSDEFQWMKLKLFVEYFLKSLTLDRYMFTIVYTFGGQTLYCVFNPYTP